MVPSGALRPRRATRRLQCLTRQLLHRAEPTPTPLPTSGRCLDAGVLELLPARGSHAEDNRGTRIPIPLAWLKFAAMPDSRVDGSTLGSGDTKFCTPRINLNYCGLVETPNFSRILHPLQHGRRGFAKVTGSDVKVGNVIERKGRIFQVTKAQHTQQGRGGATIQVELRDVQSGLKSVEKLRTAESIETVFVDSKPFTFLYAEGQTATLMDPNTYEQLVVPTSMFGVASPLLKEGMEVSVKYFNNEPLMGQLPRRVTVQVTKAEPHVKGNTATPSQKKVTVDGGVQVQVPPFVVEGDSVVIDTETMSYITRA